MILTYDSEYDILHEWGYWYDDKLEPFFGASPIMNIYVGF